MFTSTVNVRFNGTEILGGDEDDDDCITDFDFIDHYSETKFQAEKIILNAKDEINTCVLRLA